VVLSEWDPRRGRQGRTWRRLVQQLCPPGSVCQATPCRYLRETDGLILFGLRHNHPWGPSLHHLVSPLDGGHPTDPRNLVPAHFGCNASIGRPGAGRGLAGRPRSRDWPPLDLS